MNVTTNRKVWSLVIPVLVLLSGCTNKPEEFSEIVQIEKPIPYHIVREGDTVGSISEKYAMTRSELIKLNDLIPPYQLYNGQRLIVNIKPGTSASNKDFTVIEKTPKVSPPEPVVEEPKDNSDFLHVEERKPQEDQKPEKLSSEDSTKIAAVKEGAERQQADLMWPIADGKSKIAQNYEDSSDGGVIIKTSAGTVVKAISDGVIKIAKSLDGDASAYGKTVAIRHDNPKRLSIYSHLLEISVKEGQKVKKGTIIGKVGRSGSAKTPQLFFQVFNINSANKRVSVDPEKLLP
jgi:murein DD-endopeptidase MepM/ murein hydrolase activator NlpD